MKGKIFNAQEVQTIIAGNKTQFREVIKPQPSRRECPYQAGQKIFCKESFVDFKKNNSGIFYKSDFDINNLVKTADLKWKPAQHMKQEHSRLTLEITDVKVERLQSISQKDCAKEGIKHTMWQANGRLFSAQGEPIEIGFAGNWNATHKKPKEKFGANPFVWVVDFKINK